MAIYELTTGTQEDFFNTQAKLISDFTAYFIDAKVYNSVDGNGYIADITGTSFANLVLMVAFDSGSTKAFLASTIASIGFLKFPDEAMTALYSSFVEADALLQRQRFDAQMEQQRREKEELKLEKKRKNVEKKMAELRVSAEKELSSLIDGQKQISKADEFYYALGWLAKHVGTITAKMPDYIERAFVKHFGDVERTVVDSTKVGPSGYTSQWRLSMEASLKKASNIPAMLSEYLSQSGKKIAKTSFVWDLVDKYGFKFGKTQDREQDILDIMRCVPIEYVHMFNEGLKA